MSLQSKWKASSVAAGLSTTKDGSLQLLLA